MAIRALLNSTLYTWLKDNNLELIQAIGEPGSGDTTASVISDHLARISSQVSLSGLALGNLASTASLAARFASLYDVIQAAVPQVCQMAIGGVPLPVRADDNIGGTVSSVRHRYLAITNGAATMAIGWGLMNPAAGVTRTMLNSFLILPNTSMVIPDAQAFRSGSSAISLAGLYALCASASSGARACFLWHQLPVNYL